MDCREYRALYPELTAYPLPSGTWDDPQWDAWMGHRLACDAGGAAPGTLIVISSLGEPP